MRIRTRNRRARKTIGKIKRIQKSEQVIEE